MRLRHELLENVRRVVIKLGSGLLTDDRYRLSIDRIRLLVQQFASVHQRKRQVIIVSSGAIAAGMAEFTMAWRPKELPELQAAAAIGQSKLMALYDEVFGGFGIHVAQVLLTHDDLKNRARHLNARNTIQTLLAHGVVPIINENDTVAVEEIRFGDNDRLGALAATLMDADLLIILSHVAGLLDGEQLVPVVERITPEIERLAGGTQRLTSVGGMKSKIDAAKIVTRAGVPMIIASGERPDVVADLLAGEDIGTIFLPQTGKLASRKRWIAFFQHPVGVLVVDDGARAALCTGGKSLLQKGVVRSEGKFTAGDLVSIHDVTGHEFARGLIRVDEGGVMVHRDDLVIL